MMKLKMILALAGVALVAVLAAAFLLLGPLRARSNAQDDTPHYTADGRLIPPANYREWVFLSAGLDMNYVQFGSTPTEHVFGNVFAPPVAYQAFQRTGHWPDKTVLILENRAGRTGGSINRSGQFQAGVIGLEAHVRDEARFEGGWGFFFLVDGTPGDLIAKEANCYSCHQANGAVDTTFVQFYPTLLGTAQRLGTVKPGFSFDIEADAP